MKPLILTFALVVIFSDCKRKSPAIEGCSVVVYWGSTHYLLDDCVANLKNGQLDISIRKSKDSSFTPCELRIHKSGDTVEADLAPTVRIPTVRTCHHILKKPESA